MKAAGGGSLRLVRSTGDPAGSTSSRDTPVVPVSIVVCTCGRLDIHTSLETILQNSDGPFELIIVQQLASDGLDAVLADFVHAEDVHVVRSRSIGLSRARNIGLAAAAHDVVVFTDDDCRVEPGWLHEHRQRYALDPRAALCFGQVHPGPHDHAAGYVPHFLVEQSHCCTSVLEHDAGRGIGANMSVRKSRVLEWDGFDPELGAGASFRSCEDRDMALRCLLAGYSVWLLASSIVIHDGFRTWSAGRSHTFNDWVGIGSVTAKCARCRLSTAWPLIRRELGHHAARPFIVALFSRHERPGWRRISGFLAGFMRGLRSPVNRTTMCFVDQLPVAGADPLEMVA